MTTQLLVSVKNAAEAAEAVAGGADIVDIKDPSRGPLGYAGPTVIADVVRTVDSAATVSAALGEAAEWTTSPPQTELAELAKLTFLKPGPSELAAEADWTAQMTLLRNQYLGSLSTQWVAVAYADNGVCNAPTPQEVLNRCESCAGFLIDTFSKSAGSTLDLLEPQALQTLRQQCRERGMFFALAGRIQQQHLQSIVELQPDIVGVRGAVCEHNDRTGRLTRTRVHTFKSALSQAIPVTMSSHSAIRS